jgi:hypothetical protein
LLVCIRAAAGLSVHVACAPHCCPGVRPGIRRGAGAGVCSCPFAVVLDGVVVGVGVRRVGIRPCWRWRWPVRSSVGTGRCWSSAVALVVAFVPVCAGVDVDPFCLLIGAGVVLVDWLYSSAVARVLAGWSCSSAVAVVVASVLAAFALVLALAGSFL